MSADRVQSPADIEGRYLRLPIPVKDPETFRYSATADIISCLAEHPDRSFTNRELHRITGHGMSGVNAAIDSLDALGLIDVDRTGRSNNVRIDTTKLVSPEDPVAAVPQSEFHEPIRAVLARLDETLDSEFGVILFGSVAHGTADRASDIDLLVVVETDRMTAQRDAHTIEQSVADKRFDGERYEPHLVVETPETAVQHDRIERILAAGITLREATVIDAIETEVLANGSE